MRYLLDTSAILSHFQGEKGAEQVNALFENSKTEIFVSILSKVEFIRKVKEVEVDLNEVRRIWKEYSLLWSEVIPVDEKVTESSVEIFDQMNARIPMIDSLIAASAHSKKAILVHRDQHLLGIPSTLVEQIYLG